MTTLFEPQKLTASDFKGKVDPIGAQVVATSVFCLRFRRSWPK